MLIAIGFTASCNDEYDDTELRDRIESLEVWQESINTQLATLQQVVSALETNDYITEVEELADGSGYTITFKYSGSTTIYHGTNGDSPIINVAQATDGLYYWQLNGEWLLDENNNKIPVTGADGVNGEDGIDGADGINGQDGADGITPMIQINESTNEWEISIDGGITWDSTNVTATGTSGNTLFNSVDVSDPDYVTFKLTTGVSFTIPRISDKLVSFSDYSKFSYSSSNNKIELIHPSTVTDGDIQAIVAKVLNNSGTSQDIVTRASASTDLWGVEVVMPTFTYGVLYTNAYVVLQQPTDATTGDIAILEVTYIDSDGNSETISRIIEITSTSIPDNYTSEYIDIEGSTYYNTDIPEYSYGIDSFESDEVSYNSQAISGGINYIEIVTTTQYNSFNIAVEGISGYFNIESSKVETSEQSTQSFSYRIPILFGSNFNGDIVIFVSGVTVDGKFTPHYKVEIMYVETATGDLAINLAFNNAKDIDLHLIEPDGNRIYYGNRMTVLDDNGDLIYGLDHDSNAACNIDNLNNENIVIPYESLQNGIYRVIVDLYSNCDPTIATQWNSVARYNGEIISPLAGDNPASGIYEIGASKSIDDNTADDDKENDGYGVVVMTFLISDAPTSSTTASYSVSNSNNKIIKRFDPSIEKWQ